MARFLLCGLCVAVLHAAGCAAPPSNAQAFSFAIIGDAPYKEREEAPFARMMERIDREDVAFVIHVGDIGRGGHACTNDMYERRYKQFERSRHPLIYTPGDNEWVDCRGKSYDSLERLAALRRVFFTDGYSLGLAKLPLEVQQGNTAGCTAYPENRAWIRAGIVFATINVPGSNDNVGFNAASDAEARCRFEANRRWVERAAASARDAHALVVAMQANPWFTSKPVYKDLLALIERTARSLGKPVLLVHGDTHNYRVDTPFTDALGVPLASLTRVETYGSPIIGWVKVTVDPSRAQPFAFEPHLIAVVP